MQKPMRFLHTFEEIRSMIELPELRELGVFKSYLINLFFDF